MSASKNNLFNVSSIIVTVLIGIHFFYSGSAYISQMYSLFDSFEPQMIDIIALRYNYFFQALGIIAYFFVLKKRLMTNFKLATYLYPLIPMAVFVPLMLMMANPNVRLWSGFGFNFMFGYTSGMIFAYLANFIIPSHRARVFGVGYAFGSLGTYFLSNANQGQILASKEVTWFYLGFIGLHAFLLTRLSYAHEEKPIEISPIRISKRWVILILMLFAMATLSELSSSYKSAFIFSGDVNLALMRVFYAFSLVIAGFVADTDRKWAIWAALISLIFSFYIVYIFSQANLVFLAWSSSYALLGFYTLYRIIAWIDLADASKNLLPFTIIGLAIGRLGEATSTFLYVDDTTVEFIIISLLFVCVVVLFINYQNLNIKNQFMANDTARTRYFVTNYHFSSREKDIFNQLTMGKTNDEIGRVLFISESTVKFHMKNILAKTKTRNRQQLLELYHSQYEQ